MNKLFKVNIIVCLIFVVFLSLQSCSSSSKKFLGTWRNQKYKEEILIITQSGKNFIIETQNVGGLGDKVIPASYDKENDKLIINIGGGSHDIVVDERTNLLLFATKQFEKQ